MLILSQMAMRAFLLTPLLAAQPGQESPSFSAEVDGAEVSAWSSDAKKRGTELPLTGDELQAFRDQVLAALELRDGELLQLESLEPITDATIQIHLADPGRTLRLSPYSLRSPDFSLLVPDETGALVQVQPPPALTYRGGIDEDPGAQVAASIHDGQLHSLILDGGGEQWAIEPLQPAFPWAPGNLHVVYRASDVIGGSGTCGVDELMPTQPAGPVGESVPGESTERGFPFGRTEIAFDADFEYFQRNGSSVDLTVHDIEMHLNQVGLVYQNQVDICYALTGILVWTTAADPYNATSAAALRCEFRTFWNGPVVPFERDVAHLMTDRELDGTTIGIAYLPAGGGGVVCDVVLNDSTCTPAAAPSAYALSELYWLENDSPTPGTTTLVERTALVAHELGHNWGACHCDQAGCTGGGADADCGIMWSTTGAQQSSLLFSSRSVTAITSHRDSQTCLDVCCDPVYVDRNAPTGGSGCTLVDALRTVDEGVHTALVGGTVIIDGSGHYPEPTTVNKQVTLEATNGPVVIGE